MQDFFWKIHCFSLFPYFWRKQIQMVYSLKLEGNKYSFLTDIARNVKSLFFMLEYEEMLTYTENEAILINLCVKHALLERIRQYCKSIKKILI